MNSSSRLLRPRPKTACQLCEYILTQPVRQQRFLSSAFVAESSRPRLRDSNSQRPRQLPRNASSRSASSPSPHAPSPTSVQVENALSPTDAAAEVGNAQKAVNAVLRIEDSVPSEEVILQALKLCERAAVKLTGHGNKKPRIKQRADGPTSPASMLLGLDPQTTSASLEKPVDLLSTLAYKLMTHPTVFITPKILDVYVKAQSMLQRPESFPEILYLYANKPIPEPNSSPIKYKEPNPKKVSAAVPAETANRALDAAIDAKDLHLALSVIELTFRQPAYSRAKILTKVGPPALGFALAPGAAYILAGKYAEYQQTVEPATATNIALAGILGYVGAVAMVGVVAVTTANDHMDRVTWAPGMALTERWIREEERAAVDRVAQAWGFKDALRRGEEEGEEWDELREWVGLRGMVLDKVELMEGMQ